MLDLRIGRLDATRKVFYAQLANDTAVLTLPDTLLEVLPKNAMAFRDHSLARRRAGVGAQVDHHSCGPR